LRPPRVALRARKPILRARFLRCGRNVGFIVLWQKEGQVRRAAGGVSSERFWPQNRPAQAPDRYFLAPAFPCEQPAHK
jgi:hypothetical protein